VTQNRFICSLRGNDEQCVAVKETLWLTASLRSPCRPHPSKRCPSLQSCASPSFIGILIYGMVPAGRLVGRCSLPASPHPVHLSLSLFCPDISGMFAWVLNRKSGRVDLSLFLLLAFLYFPLLPCSHFTFKYRWFHSDSFQQQDTFGCSTS